MGAAAAVSQEQQVGGGVQAAQLQRQAAATKGRPELGASQAAQAARAAAGEPACAAPGSMMGSSLKERRLSLASWHAGWLAACLQRGASSDDNNSARQAGSQSGAHADDSFDSTSNFLCWRAQSQQSSLTSQAHDISGEDTFRL